MRTIICKILSLIIITLSLASTKEYGAVFTDIRGSARIQALGNAGISLDRSLDGLVYNPAWIAGLDSLAFYISYRNALFGNHFTEIMMANDFGFGKLGIAFSLLSVPLGKVYVTGTSTGEKDLVNISLGLTYQRDVGPFSLGVSTKFLQEDLDKYASPTIAFDIGTLVRIRPNAKKHRINIGLAIRNLGLGMKFNATREALNMSAGLGLMYQPFYALAVAVDGVYEMGAYTSIHSGLEIMPRWFVTPRVGFDLTLGGTESRKTITLGTGFEKELGSVTLGIDWSSAIDFNSTIGFDDHAFTVQIRRPAVWKVKKKIKQIEWDGTSKINIAVADFTAEGVDEQLANNAADFLRNNLGSSPVFVVVRREKMQALMSEQELQLSGITSGGSTVEIGKMLNVQKFIYGKLMKQGSDYYIQASVVDVETGKEEVSIEEMAGSIADIRSAVSKIAHLLDPSMNKKDLEKAGAEKQEEIKIVAEDSLDDFDEIDATREEKYPAIFREGDPRKAQEEALVDQISTFFEAKQYYDAVKKCVSIFNLSPYNIRGRKNLQKIYPYLSEAQKRKVGMFFEKMITKYAVDDPEKSKGYQEIADILVEL